MLLTYLMPHERTQLSSTVKIARNQLAIETRNQKEGHDTIRLNHRKCY